MKEPAPVCLQPASGGATLGRPRSIDRYRERVIELKAQGLSRRKIAGELGIPASNVGRLLAKAA